MKLLFDHNISPSLVHRLQDLYSGSEHVYNLQLHEKSDSEVWEFARHHDFVVVTKDADFSELSMQKGFPPKLLWLRIGNCRTSDIEDRLRNVPEALEEFYEDRKKAILSVFKKSAG